MSPFHDHSATASVQELRPSALRSELAYHALRVLDSSPLEGSGSLSKNFCPWQRSYAATWEQRTFEVVTELSFGWSPGDCWPICKLGRRSRRFKRYFHLRLVRVPE